MLPGMERRQSPGRMRKLLCQQERQGWSWSELSRRSGLPVWKLRWWQRRFARDARQAKRGFVRVEVLETQRGRPPLEVVTGSGARILVPVDFDAEHLKRLVKALGLPC